MVRLVFRPYTQVWRTICTSVSLRASTRVSPGFTLLKHSSPSFGSYQICSYSNPSQKIKVGRCCPCYGSHLALPFSAPMSFSTRKLAYVIDSLVRVSRRVSTNHLGKIAYKRPQSSRPFGTWAGSKPPTFHTLIPVGLNPSCLLPPKSQETSIGIRQPLTNCYPHQTYITPLTSKTIDSFVPLPSQRFQVF